MQHHPNDDPYEREPLDASYSRRTSVQRRPVPQNHGYAQPESPYQGGSPPGYANPPQDYHHSPVQNRDDWQQHRSDSPYDDYNQPPAPPPHGHSPQYTRGGESNHSLSQSRSHSPSRGNHDGESAAGGMAGIAYGVAERNARESGVHAMQSAGQIPPPPSRTANYGNTPYHQGGAGYPYDAGYAPAAALPVHSPHNRSMNNLRGYDYYADDPYQGYSSSSRSDRLGVVDPNDIEDDGDDGLYYPRHSQRNSMLSSAANSDRGAKRGIVTATAVGGAAAGGAAVGGLLRKGRDGGPGFDATGAEKNAEWEAKRAAKKKRWKWVVIIAGLIIILGAIAGGVAGGVLMGARNGGGSGGSGSGESAEEDTERNGDLNLNSEEIKDLMDNPDLHRVFPGMDYTPIHSQYPDCIDNPPSQNNITRDVAVLSQLTNKIRLYGTDCNQTQMVLHAIDRLELQDDVKVWLGVWQDDNSTTNARQLEQMWEVLDEYGGDPFEGLIVANEILFREEMTITELGNLLEEVRSNLTDRNIDLPVATSDLGDDWTEALGDTSDYIMANIHPFFAGVAADEAAAWTMNFWETNNGPIFKPEDSRNIISETGWPSGGGKNCGGSTSNNCSPGSVAGIDELNQFMEDFVCPALENGTNYFWFSAFDEPWKVRFNEDGKEWEDKWGLMDVNRNLKDGVIIPDCDGQTV